jgi:hypothetical protein
MVQAKKPGPEPSLRTIDLSLIFADELPDPPEPYERLLDESCEETPSSSSARTARSRRGASCSPSWTRHPRCSPTPGDRGDRRAPTNCSPGTRVGAAPGSPRPRRASSPQDGERAPRSRPGNTSQVTTPTTTPTQPLGWERSPAAHAESRRYGRRADLLTTGRPARRAASPPPQQWRLAGPPAHAPSTRANHHDLVRPSHLAGGEPGPVTKAHTIKEKRHDTGNGQIIRQAYDFATLLGRDGGDVSDAEAVLVAVPIAAGSQREG